MLLETIVEEATRGIREIEAFLKGGSVDIVVTGRRVRLENRIMKKYNVTPRDARRIAHHVLDNSFSSVPGILNEYNAYEDREMTPERDAIAALMAEDHNAAGLTGVETLYFQIKGRRLKSGREYRDLSKKGRR